MLLLGSNIYRYKKKISTKNNRKMKNVIRLLVTFIRFIPKGKIIFVRVIQQNDTRFLQASK